MNTVLFPGSPTMESIVAALLVTGKGLLAADESLPTIGKRFKAINIEVTSANRRAYRELLFTTPQLNEFISGTILFDETIRQTTQAGVPMPDVLSNQGIIPGIKVDLGTIDLVNFTVEKITSGQDGLRDRLIEYRELGARFTKWRAVIGIGSNQPSTACIQSNAEALAIFAALSQEAGLVPIVEPEVLMNGDHCIASCEDVTSATLRGVFEALAQHKVKLELMLLKTGMVVSGSDCAEQGSIEDVAECTLRCLRRTVPAAVPGIVFLSGGQGAEMATLRMNAVCRAGSSPWKLSFSFGRALQAPALKIWNGLESGVLAAQTALLHRARCNSSAVLGNYSPALEVAQ